MALYAGRAQEEARARHFLQQAQKVRSRITRADTDKEWHIEWYYQMTTARVSLSTGKADHALAWLPARVLTGDGQIMSLLVWAEAYLAAGEKNCAANCLREVQINLTALPLPQRQAKFDQLARQL